MILLTPQANSTEFIAGKLENCEEDISSQQSIIVSIEDAIQKLPADTDQNVNELEKSISKVQAVNSKNAFELRSNVANRLREIIVELKLGVEGTKPKRSELNKFLDESGIDKDEARKLTKILKKYDDDGQSGTNRRFKSFN